jgi:WD40 repeat protein
MRHHHPPSPVINATTAPIAASSAANIVNVPNWFRLWNPATGAPVRVLTGHDAPVDRLAFSTDGRLLASTDEDDTVLLWNPATGELIGALSDAAEPAFSPNSQLLASYLMCPAVRPDWTWRWSARYKTSTGTIAITTPAKSPL